MRIICAFDSFKECISSSQASEAAAHGARKAFPGADILIVPGADGGEGTGEILAAGKDAERVSVFAHDALFRPITASYYFLRETAEAFIDFASASGLSLIPPAMRDPMIASSFGTGEMILHAFRMGAERVTLCFGGSATSDGGVGMLQALGVKFLRADGSIISAPICPAVLTEAAEVSTASLNPLCRNKKFVGLYDTTARFCGSESASVIFSRQKGAYGDMPQILDAILSDLWKKFKTTGPSCPLFPGSGAAGGAGGAWAWILGAEMIAGGEAVLDAAGFDSLVTPDTIVLTGEGKSDSQTLTGKFPHRVLARAREAGADVILLSGSVEDRDALLAAGFKTVESITPSSMPLEEALRREIAVRNLTEAVSSSLRNSDLFCV